MGEVWSGTHLSEGVPVAVKVIKGAKARSTSSHRAIANEVRAVARLHHPGVVVVLDYGEVDSALSAASRGRFVAESPYLVMELVPGGALDEVSRPLQWFEIKAIMLALLDALGHAHARGVIHRDIKPANILLNDAEDVTRGVKLTDFGIAHALLDNEGRHAPSEQLKGTGAYMAPEQIRGLWRDYGPWTDLYALGCVAYELIGGEPPFADKAFVTLLHKHLSAKPEPVVPRVAVPEGVQQWLDGFLGKRPAHRYQRASDAARALELLGDVFPSTESVDVNRVPEAVDERDTTRTAETLVVDAVEGLPEIQGEGVSVHVVSRPVPETWRRGRAEALPSSMLLGAGLGLFGLRTIPTVGREIERDALWSALLSVEETRRPHAVVVRGATGMGKSRLCEWFCERAQESGAANALKAEHSTSMGVADGLSRMVTRKLRCLGLSRAEILLRTEMILSGRGFTNPREWHALTELMSPASLDAPVEAHDVRFSSSAERYYLIYRLLEWYGQNRPIVVWLDDVQWGCDALNFAQFVLERGTPCPALLVMTVQDEALSRRPVERHLLDRLLALEEVQQLGLGPLSQDESRALVGRLLGLEPGLAAQAEARAAGNPLFAIQLVTDWVQRGVLESSEKGLALRSGAHLALPDNLLEVWSAHLERHLEGQEESARISLELAATLGMSVDRDELDHVCGLVGVAVDERLMAALLRARLLDSTESGWRFVHGMLRESLIRMADKAARLQTHHLACARMLEPRHEARHAGIASRLGLHLAESGYPSEALEPILEGALQLHLAGDDATALTLISRRTRCLDTLDRGERDAARLSGQLLRAAIDNRQGRTEQARDQIQRIIGLAEDLGEDLLLAKASLRMAAVHFISTGDANAAAASLERAQSLFRIQGDSEGLGEAIAMLGRVSMYQGDYETAARRLDQSRRIFEALEHPRGVVYAVEGLGDVAEAIGDLTLARRHYTDALSLSERLGHRERTAGCLSGLAGLARHEGRLDEALSYYERALDCYRSIGQIEGCFAIELNLAMLQLIQARHDEARTGLEKLLVDIESSARTKWHTTLHLLLLPCAAASGDEEAWARHMAVAVLARDPTRHSMDPDEARCVQLAASLALGQGWPEAAREAFEIARHLWTFHKRLEKVAEIDSALADQGLDSLA